MGEYLNYDGLEHFKERDDERYLKEVEVYKIPWLVDKTNQIKDDDIILIGRTCDKGMLSIPISSFLSNINTSEPTVSFESGDAEDSDEWEKVDVIKSGESNSTLFNKISTMVKNVRYLFNRSNDMEGAIDSINETIDGLDILDKTYPIGSIYMSINSTDPGDLFGGSWNRIEDAFLLAAGAHSAGETGGAETVTLSSSQIPSHTHSIPALSGTAASAGSHTHTGPSHTHSLPSHTHSIPSHTHSIPSLSGTAASAGSHRHDLNVIASAAYDNDNGVNRPCMEGNQSGTYSTAIASSGDHTHSVTTTASTTGSYSGTSGSTSDTSGSSGTGSTGSAGSHTHDVTTVASTSGSTGSGSSHENMPPYLSVYMWQRVA